MKKTLQVANGIAFVCVIVMNYLSNTGLMNNTTIGTVSNHLTTLFTPSGYAFSIWGFIYLLLLGFIIYQGKELFGKQSDNNFVIKTGWWFFISCVANCSWIVAWIYGYTLLSCFFIFLILIALLKIITNNAIGLGTPSKQTLLFLWLPFAVYSGWITVASIVNVAVVLVKYNWDGFGLQPEIWTIIMIVVATLVNLMVTWKRNLKAFAFVGSWALLAIYVANKDSLIVVAYTALLASVLLIFSNLAKVYFNFRRIKD
jgi:hypothetical protein